MNIRETNRGVCVEGFKAAGVREGKYGLAMIVSKDVHPSAGVFTRNNVKAAPVTWTEKRVRNGLQAVVANSGCANACVKEGLKDAKKMAGMAAKAVGVNPESVGVASTGIIGRRIDLKLVSALVKKASKKLSKSPKASMEAAKAIMTTDTKPKQASVELDGIEVGGICKGAGMIAPNMATMLCFITTNASLTGMQMQKALESSADRSFNMLVVDGDMSTNDTIVLMSSGRKKCGIETFQKLLDYVTLKLAKMVAQDGEGASKYIEVEVSGARDRNSAVKAAKAVVSSPLVKTAFYGENPNWGRIISAIGSKTNFNPMRASITFKSGKGNAIVFNQGKVGNRDKAVEVLKGKEIKVAINLRSGNGKATVYGCDLTEDYVRINAGYN